MYIIIYDFGTSSVKTCLFKIDSEIRFVAGSSAGYGLYITDNGGAKGIYHPMGWYIPFWYGSFKCSVFCNSFIDGHSSRSDFIGSKPDLNCEGVLDAECCGRDRKFR